MKSVFKMVGVVAAGLAATADMAFAAVHNLNVPEPGSLALVGLAVGALVVAARARKK